jgi:hypothetical protein
LADQTAEDLLAGGVDPVIRKRADDGTSDLRFARVEMARWIRTTGPRNDGHHAERCGGLPTSSHGPTHMSGPTCRQHMAPVFLETVVSWPAQSLAQIPKFAKSSTSNTAAIA